MPKKKTNIPFIISSIIFIGGLIAMGLYIFSIKSEESSFDELKIIKYQSEETINDNKKEEKDEELDYYLIDNEIVQAKYKDLYIKNNDLIGWIKIDNTPIDYPVMCTPEDEQFYIHRNFDKEYSFGGCIFAGAGTNIRKPSDNIITYGHHMIDRSMYHDIDEYETEEYYKAHKYIYFDTLRQTGKYEVIAAFRTEIHPDDYEGFTYWKFVDAKSKEEFDEFIQNCKSLTPVDMDGTAEYGDQLLTLSTCAYHNTNGRFVVVAKRIEGKEIDYNKEPLDKIQTK